MILRFLIPSIDVCPEATIRQFGRASSAIEWLNNELAKLRTLPVSLAEDRHVNQRALGTNSEALNAVVAKIGLLDTQVEDFEKKRSHLEVAIEAKLSVISALKTMKESPVAEIERRIKQLESDIDALKLKIKERYDVVDHHAKVDKRVRELMKEIGAGFEFEASYRPINLRFSSETFELWHLDKENEKVFLRSMGSGANWLSCHLTLFLSLHRYFCELGEGCVIPPILFFDQPSQVYFPTILDADEKFDPALIGDRKGATQTRKVDDDIKAVSNLFSRFVEFCALTKKHTGIEPQIIVTDHADNLVLDGETTFQSLVREKWRGATSGLIQISEIVQPE